MAKHTKSKKRTKSATKSKANASTIVVDRETIEKMAASLKAVAEKLGGKRDERPRSMHLPDETAEREALRESYRSATKGYEWRLRDLITMAAGPSGVTNWEGELDDPDEYGDENIATKALEAVADELDVLAIALDGQEAIAEDELFRIVVRLSKRARAAAELSRRLQVAGPPAFVPDSDPDKVRREAQVQS